MDGIKIYSVCIVFNVEASDDEEALAMFLAMLAGGSGGGGGEMKGGESEAEFDEESGKLKIRATGVIFPFLVHEIIKGLYEIVSLQGFTKSKEQNQATVAATDRLEYEPEDFAFGTHIQEALGNNNTKYSCRNLNNAIKKYGQNNFTLQLLYNCNL